ncbi:hypothetical protein SCUCBS95973_001247 [Sporothrix curviconia]|uniref:Amidohydrolase-related domain-containing protein n=1 Tax=Sporothrix curviconia TaxID=1260050 RepID=A0ABP0AX07_9PEZI
MAKPVVPPGAWDTHIHVFDPQAFPYAVPRPYTPKPAAIAEYPVNVTSCTNIVVVHASMQGTSPAPLLDTLAKSTPANLRLRGLATIDVDNITDAELDALHAAGVRGARMHEMAWGHGAQNGADAITVKVERLAARLARLGWVVGIFCPLPAWAAMADMIRTRLDPRIKLVADHFGSAFPGDATTPEFAAFLELVREKRVFVKISGFERLYDGHPDGIESLTPAAKAIIAAGPDQIVFGSDWPHTQLGVSRKGKTAEQRINEVEGFRTVDNAGHIAKIREWIPDEETWYKFWVTNPQRLFE